jgi:S1-C subfamily serine protease
VIVSSERIAFHGSTEYTTIRDRDAEFFRAWHLYTSAEAGATLWSAFGVVGVNKVTPDSRFDNAGVKPGDILAQINGTPIRSIRDAHRSLCRATISWGAADLTIIRGGSRHEQFVSLYEW